MNNEIQQNDICSVLNIYFYPYLNFIKREFMFIEFFLKILISKFLVKLNLSNYVFFIYSVWIKLLHIIRTKLHLKTRVI